MLQPEQPEENEILYTDKYPELAKYLVEYQARRVSNGVPERILKTLEQTDMKSEPFVPVRSCDNIQKWPSNFFNDLSVQLILWRDKKEFSAESAIEGLIKRLKRFIESKGSSEAGAIFRVEENLFHNEKALNDFINLICSETKPTFGFDVVSINNEAEDKENKYKFIINIAPKKEKIMA